jgi:arsenite methyltransferase
LRRHGVLAIFDGDYATTTVALGDHDPLQTCVDAMVADNVQDRWLMRRLPVLVRRAGFEVTGFRSHGYVEAGGAEYMLTIVDRGADILTSLGQVDDEGAAALKEEARRRVAAGTFFGHIRVREPHRFPAGRLRDGWWARGGRRWVLDPRERLLR